MRPSNTLSRAHMGAVAVDGPDRVAQCFGVSRRSSPRIRCDAPNHQTGCGYARSSWSPLPTNSVWRSSKKADIYGLVQFVCPTGSLGRDACQRRPPSCRQQRRSKPRCRRIRCYESISLIIRARAMSPSSSVSSTRPEGTYGLPSEWNRAFVVAFGLALSRSPPRATSCIPYGDVRVCSGRRRSSKVRLPIR